MAASSVCEYTRNHAAAAMEEQRMAGEYDSAAIDDFQCMTCSTDGCNPTLASGISAARAVTLDMAVTLLASFLFWRLSWC
jgi:hypothetical protein